MKKGASIYLRRSKLYVDSESRTIAGFWIGTGVVRVVDEGDAAAAASALREALAESKMSVPTPAPGVDLTGPMLKAAAVKTWRSFVRNAKCVGARLSDGEVTLLPYRRIDKAGTYIPVPENAEILRLSSPELGLKILETFRKAG